MKTLLRIFAAGGLIAASFWGCDFKEPVLPSWQVTVRAPFLVDDFRIGEEIRNDSTIVLQGGDPDSVLFVSLSDSMIELFQLGREDLSIKPRDTETSIRIGTLELDSLEALETSRITLGELFPNLSDSLGQPALIPETVIAAPPVLLSAGDFRSVHFLSGTIRLRVTNLLPFPIGPNSQQPQGMHIRVVNDSAGTDFADLDFTEVIPPGGSGIAESIVTDKTLESPLRLEITVPVAQATFIPEVTQALLDTAGFLVRISLLDIEADEATVILQSQDYQDDVWLTYDDENRLRSAVMDAGQITIHLFNHMDINSQGQIKIPAISAAGIDTFTRDISFPALGDTIITLRFDDREYTIENPDQPGQIIDSLQLILSAQTEASGRLVRITSEDSITLALQSDSLFFRHFAGVIGVDTLQITPFEERNIADYEGFEEGLELSEALLSLTLRSEVMIGNLNADLRITAFHENEQGQRTDSALIILDDLQFNGGNPGQPGITEIVLSGPEIVNALNILPTALRIDGQVRVSGEAEISREDRILTDYLFETPFKVRFTNLSTFSGDPDSLTDADIDDLIRDAGDDNLLGASLEMIIRNHTPLGGTVRFIFTADMADSNLYDGPVDTAQGFERTISMTAAPTDPATGFVTGEQNSRIQVTLNQRELRLFQNPPLQFGYQIRFDDTDGFVTLRYSDYVNMLGEVRVNILIEDQN